MDLDFVKPILYDPLVTHDNWGRCWQCEGPCSTEEKFCCKLCELEYYLPALI